LFPHFSGAFAEAGQFAGVVPLSRAIAELMRT
jgi:hypothetical protein